MSIDYNELSQSVKISLNLHRDGKLVQKNPNPKLIKVTNKSESVIVVLKNDTIIDPRNTKFEKIYLEKNKTAKLGKGMRWEVHNTTENYVYITFES